MNTGTLRRLDVLASDGVERADPTGPPVAFRIWKAGVNITDHGSTVFSERSAVLLMEQQATRGNRFPIDVDHLSLDKEAPIAARKAVGWFNIEVRDGELWARDVEWTDVVRDGLTKEPPEWRYHSPAYDQDSETGEVIGLVNLAITNLPATHAVTALATRRVCLHKDSSRMATKKRADGMKWSALKAAIEGTDEDAKMAAYAALADAFPDEATEGAERDAEGGEEPKKDPLAPAADAEDEPEKKDAEDAPEKKDSKSVGATVTASIDAALAKANARIAALEARDESAARTRLIASREMTPALAKTLANKPLKYVQEICNALPEKKPAAKGTETIQATRGANAANADSSPSQKDAIAQRMGLVPSTRGVRHDGNKTFFDAMTREDAQRALATKKGDNQ